MASSRAPSIVIGVVMAVTTADRVTGSSLDVVCAAWAAVAARQPHSRGVVSRMFMGV
mgnify:CR=1 FL=1